MYTVVGYHDLRPVDWQSGKRLPLAPGEGHTCDRCEREHAVVFEVRDSDTGKVYSVGSGCARAEFGFDPDKTEEVRAIAKKAKKELELQLNQRRYQEAEDLSNQILTEVLKMDRPEIVRSPGPAKYPLVKAVWTCGDGESTQSSHTNDEESGSLAEWHWMHNRIMERIPAEWGKIVVGNHPNRLRGTNMRDLCDRLALHKVHDHLR